MLLRCNPSNKRSPRGLGNRRRASQHHLNNGVQVMSDVDSNVPDGFQQIPGFPRYAVSEDGTILSICGNGRGAHRNLPWSEARRIAPDIASSNGYPRVTLRQDGRKHQVHVHTLVLTVFSGPRPDGMECRHLDGNKLNYHATNLKWGTRSDNINDRILHGTACRGERHGQTKLTDADVLEIRRRAANGEVHRVIAESFHVARTTISGIITCRKWKHLLSPKQEKI